MKNLSLILSLAFSLGLVAHAFAAADTTATDPSSKATYEQRSEQTRQAEAAAACRDQKLTLQLDHGPRAATTPWLNEQRRLNFEAQKQACVARAMQNK